MTISSESTILYDGPRRAVVQFNGREIDGNGPLNLSSVSFFDASGLRPVPESVRITNLEAAVAGGTIELYWAADEPVLFATLSGPDIDFDYARTQPARPPAGSDGSLLISTYGFSAEVNSSYFVKLEFLKRVV